MRTQYASACLCLQESWLVTYTLALGGSDSLPEASEAPKTDVSPLPTTTRKHCDCCTVARGQDQEGGK